MEKGKCSNCSREKAGYLYTLVRLFKIALLPRNTISKKETAKYTNENGTAAFIFHSSIFTLRLKRKSYLFHSSARYIQFYKHIDMNSLYQHIFHH